MNVIYSDRRIIVCEKPVGVLSTDEPGGMPELLRSELGDEHACVRTVHRLDRVVGGVMVFARSRYAAAELSRQVREHEFEKEYLAVIRGVPDTESGVLEDYLARTSAGNRTCVVSGPGKDARLARLEYRVEASTQGLSLVRIRLLTGRTHQIRVQFSSRGHALVGDVKYGAGENGTPALWSHSIAFDHPESGERMSFTLPAPDIRPFDIFR